MKIKKKTSNKIDIEIVLKLLSCNSVYLTYSLLTCVNGHGIW